MKIQINKREVIVNISVHQPKDMADGKGRVVATVVRDWPNPEALQGKKAVAVCDPRDEWDAKKGKKIAVMKLRKKCLEKLIRQATLAIRNADREIEKIDRDLGE